MLYQRTAIWGTGPWDISLDGAQGEFITQKRQEHRVHLGGSPPHHPRLPRYDILALWVALNGHHTTNAQCTRGGGVEMALGGGIG